MKNLFINIWNSIKINYFFYGLALVTVQSFILMYNGRASSVSEVINLFCYLMGGLFFIDAYSTLNKHKINRNTPISKFFVLLFLGIILIILPTFLSVASSAQFSSRYS